MLRTQLSVNLNKVALLRNSREGNWPDPVFFGTIALEAGAAGLTVHPRPDERHIRATDVPALAALVAKYPDREYNIEGNPFHNLMGHLKAVRRQDSRRAARSAADGRGSGRAPSSRSPIPCGPFRRFPRPSDRRAIRGNRCRGRPDAPPPRRWHRGAWTRSGVELALSCPCIVALGTGSRQPLYDAIEARIITHIKHNR